MKLQLQKSDIVVHPASTNVDLSVYKSSYTEARDSFLADCRVLGARISSHKNPNDAGIDGKGLYCDVATFGNSDGRRALICCSGTHGIEGGVGNAIFVHAIKEGVFDRYLKDLKIVLIHSINPWGHAYSSRCTENNVDLNRNFVAHDGSYPSKPDYVMLHEACTPATCSEQAIEEFMSVFNAVVEDKGESAAVNAIFGGQYERDDGLNFGGTEAEWSNDILRNVILEHSEGLDKAVFIDWHTGLGEYAKALYFCLDDPASPSYQRMHDWYGDEFLKIATAFSGGKVPGYSGVLMNAVADELPDTQLCKLIIEFGTKPNVDIFRAFLIDRWIRFSGETDQTIINPLREDIMECYCPSDERWRESVLCQATEIIQMSLHGLSKW